MNILLCTNIALLEIAMPMDTRKTVREDVRGLAQLCMLHILDTCLMDSTLILVLVIPNSMIV